MRPGRNQAHPPLKSPIAWTIAGSDSGGGAGIQADLKVFAAFGIHGCSAITAITAQNSEGVTCSESVSETMLRAQLETLATDLPPAAIKTGMLGNAALCIQLAEFLKQQDHLPRLVCDPVLKSTSGTDLLEPAARHSLIQDLFPKVDVLTPNLPEVGLLIDDPSSTPEQAAQKVLTMGVRSVLIKGGHATGHLCRDYWTDGTQSLWLSSPRIETSATHGTGCILASAIASALALGEPLPEAIFMAKTFLNQCLKSPANVGNGCGPMKIEPFRNDPQDRPDRIN